MKETNLSESMGLALEDGQTSYTLGFAVSATASKDVSRGRRPRCRPQRRRELPAGAVATG
jgi:hypothetical protein